MTRGRTQVATTRMIVASILEGIAIMYLRNYTM